MCWLQGFLDIHNIIPLHFTGSAIYQQPSSDGKLVHKIKEALVSAFLSDYFCAYKQFIARKMGEGELVDMQHLAMLFGGMTDTSLGCAFVASLPESAYHIL